MKFKVLRRKVRAGWATQRKARRLAAAHRRYNKGALDALARQQAPLSSDARMLCDTYAQDALGSLTFAPWLYVYSAIAGEFREGWIPENYYKQYYVDRLSYRKIGAPRGLTKYFFEKNALPDIACLVDGRLILADGRIAPQKSLSAALFVYGDRIIFKADHSRRGQGVRFLSRDTFDPRALRSLGSGVFQRIVDQHPALDPISQRSLSTLRFTTAHDEDGQFSLRGGFVHTGRNADSFVAAKTAVRIAFDLETGQLSQTGYQPDWTPINRHPDTQATFNDITIPHYQACKDLALRLHRQMPYVQCVGWDIAIDPAGDPYLLEWNTGHTDIKFSEATQGPCFADLDWADRWRTS